MGLDDTAAALELREGLSRPLPEIPSKYFYDDAGSELFEEITELPEYYPTRTEERILETCVGSIAGAVACRELVELGSGVGRKIRTLIGALQPRGLERVVMLEINENFLDASVKTLQEAYPSLEVAGIVGDFEHDLARLGPGGGRLILFLAGTIGNLQPDQAAAFLAQAARQMEMGDGFLIGFDLVKDKARLEAAYDDAAGVTARFNKNILHAVNDRFGADFEPEAYEHVAFFDEENAWIEMRLRASRPMTVTVRDADLKLDLEAGDEIRTEISAKYTRESVEALADRGGLLVDAWYQDPEALFALAILKRAS